MLDQWQGMLVKVALRAVVPALLGAVVTVLVAANLLPPGVAECLESKRFESSSIHPNSQPDDFQSQINKWQEHP